MFILPNVFEGGSRPLCELELCLLRLSHDPANPWLLLIPKRPQITEICQLSEADQGLLVKEISFASNLLLKEFAPDKINVGALGNMVPTLHVHVIARYRNDRAWPGPIWGTQVPPNPAELDQIESRLKKLLAEIIK